MTVANPWIRSELRLVRTLWLNGGKALLLSSAAVMGSIILLAAALGVAWFTPTPIVEQGGTVTVEALKCNDSDEDVAVEGWSWFKNHDTQAISIRESQRVAV